MKIPACFKYYKKKRLGYAEVMYKELTQELQQMADPQKAAFFPRFFKTGKGEYGEGDVFIGVTVPQVRSVVKNFIPMELKDVEKLLESPLHECRLAALLILVDQYKKAETAQKKKIVDLYLRRTDRINNWDLVDCSAHKIIGPWTDETDSTALLDELSHSADLWEQRIAMVATFHFIRKKQLSHTFQIAETLMDHPHDLIHKACGWMLREAGKKDPGALNAFLLKFHRKMPRTMLRYAIEKLSAERRKAFMGGTND